MVHGLSCSAACGIFPDEGSNPCPLHWQADSQPLRHQGSPKSLFLTYASYTEELGISSGQLLPRWWLSLPGCLNIMVLPYLHTLPQSLWQGKRSMKSYPLFPKCSPHLWE